ncbi:hypothetical protein [Sphingomonas colocasiae]|uniref:Lectin-like protein BA14k n=1 Tax=Sphingomonas colocasiae TaxID=1848973 RepID=A0ABS7PKW5_9SPHN|nr:hypothetical protein [Sphingomonas colocasiae]MBY8821947.1 hypothetical protein [Sphingomonas colocasiae]
MVARLRRCALAIGAFAWLADAVPSVSVAHAQDSQDRRWSHRPPPRPMEPSFDRCDRLHGRDRARCEGRRDRDRRAWRHHERERERDRRNDARTEGVVAGVVGAAIIGGVIAAVAKDGKKKKELRERRRHCIDRYGNYDERTDSYRASDGRFHRCE